MPWQPPSNTLATTQNTLGTTKQRYAVATTQMPLQPASNCLEMH